MEKVKTMQEAYQVFELLGIKEVTKPWQKKKGTEVWELPFKTMYYNGSEEVNRFSVYRSGYVRKMVVHPKSNASYSCYQLNKQYKTKEKWWNSYYKEYRTWNRLKRILIDNHRDRIVYLCNYILKNYYNNDKLNFVGEYTQKKVKETYTKFWKSQKQEQDLPFRDDSVTVIINGHRYNLS